MQEVKQEEEQVEKTCAEKAVERIAKMERRCEKFDDENEKQECLNHAQAMLEILLGKCQCLDNAQSVRAANNDACKEAVREDRQQCRAGAKEEFLAMKE